MKSFSVFFIFIFFIELMAAQQGPNRTFCKHEKSDNIFTGCSENCAKIVLIYEKGTYVNAIKAALSIDSVNVVAIEKGCYAEFNITPGIHQITLPHGIKQGRQYDTQMENISQSDNTNGFIVLHSSSKPVGEFDIQLPASVDRLEFNKLLQPCDSKMFPHQVYYLTYLLRF